MVKTILEKLRTDGSVIYRIDRQSNAGEYVINSDSSKGKTEKYLSSIEQYRLDVSDKLVGDSGGKK
jgi:hypothetical protein